jgi:phage/plasmid-like protein (TIGR03299 family)
MAAHVETMAYAGETPWHGLGNKVEDCLTPEQMLVAAGLDWSVSKRGIYYSRANSGLKAGKVDTKFALVRDSDDQFLDIVGSAYKPVQNAEAMKFFKEFVEAGNATMETAGSLHDGKKVWGLAKLGEGFKLSSGDTLNSHLLLVNHHLWGFSLVAKRVHTRVVCQNTLSMALGEKGSEYRMNHLKTFDDLRISEAKEILGLARDLAADDYKIVETLAGIKLPRELQIEELAKIFQPKMEEFSEEAVTKANRTMKLLNAFLDTAPGSDLDTSQGTAWGVVNAVTYWQSHVAGRTQSARLDSAWLGENQRKTQKLIDNLLELA